MALEVAPVGAEQARGNLWSPGTRQIVKVKLEVFTNARIQTNLGFWA